MPPGNGESATPQADGSDDLASVEAAAAAAEARAEVARTRAIELRRRLTTAATEGIPGDDAPSAADEAQGDHQDDTPSGQESGSAPEVVTAPGAKRRRLRPPRAATVAGIVAILLTAGLLGITGHMVWQHRKAADQRHRTAEFNAAARQGVVNLMSMDFNHAKESVQRVIDDSTGKFKDNFQDSADALIKQMQKAKVATKVTVNDTAVESMTADSAVVLVAATSERVGADASKEEQQPRVWRVVLMLARDGDQIKISDVEFA